MPLSSPNSSCFPRMKTKMQKPPPAQRCFSTCRSLQPGNAATSFGATAGNQLIRLAVLCISRLLLGWKQSRKSWGLGSLLGYFQVSLINDSGFLLRWVTRVLAWALHAPASMPVVAREPGHSRSGRGILRLLARRCTAGDWQLMVSLQIAA